MKRTKFAGILAAMLIFGSSTVFGATPTINLQNNGNNTVTVMVKDIPRDIYGIQLELAIKEPINTEVSFEANDKNAYSFIVKRDNTLSVYITSDQKLNLGTDATIGKLINVNNEQFDTQGNQYKIVDYFFQPMDKTDIDVEYSDSTTGQPGDTDDSGNQGQPGDTDDSGNQGQPGDTDDSGNQGQPGDTDDSGNIGQPSRPVRPSKPQDTEDQDSVQQPEQPVLPTVEFTDTKNHWAAESISKMAARGVLKGYEDGTFGPSKQITRAEFAAVVARAFGFEEMITTVPFKDVQLGKWYTGPVVSLYQKGIITGRPDGTFGVNDLITNQEMAVMISRSIKALALELEAQKTYVPFVDADTISSFAQEAVKELYEVGIIAGMPDGTYQPKASATRAQVAVIVDRMLTMIEAK